MHPSRLRQPTAGVAPLPEPAHPLRILMVAPTPFFADRGCHVRILEEVRMLQTLGHRVLVSTYHHGREVEGVETTRSIRVPWYQKLSPGPSIHKFYVDWALVSSTLDAAARFRPDVVHAHLHEGIFVAHFACKRFKVPMIADLQGSLSGEVADHTGRGLTSLIHNVFGRAERWLTAKPERILSSSPRFTETLQAEFGRDDAITFDDAVDTERFQPHPPDSELQAALGLPPDKPTVVFLGVLTRYQGVDDLLQAARQVVDQRPDTHFLVMGYPNVEHYKAAATALGLDTRVIFPGRIDYDRAADALNLGDLAVSPKLSATEANGKLFNYMACGLPVAVYDTPINRQILGPSGSYAPLGDHAALARVLIELVDNAERRRHLGAALRQRAVNEFSWARSGETLVDIYLEALQQQAVARAG